MQLKQVAKLLGCHATSVANWELGRRLPGVRQLSKLIEFLGYDARPEAEGIGEQLKRKRTAMGLSVASTAKQIGVDAGSLARWESGRRRPVGKHVAKVYAFLGEDPRPVPVTIGERLKRHREALGLSQRELARRICVYPSTIERWELGQRKPSGEHRSKVKWLLRLAVDEGN